MGSTIVKTSQLEKLNVDVDPEKLGPLEKAIAKKLNVKKVEVEVQSGGKTVKIIVDDLDANEIKKAFK